MQLNYGITIPIVTQNSGKKGKKFNRIELNPFDIKSNVSLEKHYIYFLLQLVQIIKKDSVAWDFFTQSGKLDKVQQNYLSADIPDDLDNLNTVYAEQIQNDDMDIYIDQATDIRIQFKRVINCNDITRCDILVLFNKIIGDDNKETKKNIIKLYCKMIYLISNNVFTVKHKRQISINNKSIYGFSYILGINMIYQYNLIETITNKLFNPRLKLNGVKFDYDVKTTTVNEYNQRFK